MNFEEMRIIWDTQKGENLYAIDEKALRQLVEKDSFAIARDLKGLELGAIVVLCSLGVVTLIDTFFNGNEYFQLASVAMEFVVAGCLWLRRRGRESRLLVAPTNLLSHIDTAMRRAQATIHRGRDMALFFALFVLYGVGVRLIIYGWRGSEIKLVLGLVGVILLWVTFKLSEVKTHVPRLNNLKALRKALLDDHAELPAGNAS